MTKELTEKPVEPTKNLTEQPLMVKPEVNLPAVDRESRGLIDNPDLVELQELRNQPTEVAKFEPLNVGITDQNSEDGPSAARIAEMKKVYDDGGPKEEEQQMIPVTKPKTTQESN